MTVPGSAHTLFAVRIFDLEALFALRARLTDALVGIGVDTVDAAMLASGASDLGRTALSASPGAPVKLSGSIASVERGVRVVLSARWLGVAPPRQQPKVLQNVATGRDGEAWEVRGGRVLPTHVTLDARALFDLAALIEKPTARELMMAQVEAQNARLTTQQEELAEAVAKATRATNAKSDFLASMSHELRTPMNSIIGFTRRLLKRLDGKIGPAEADALQTVDRNAKHLLALINDILDLSKIEAGKVEISTATVDLDLLVGEVLAQCSSLVEGKPHKLDRVRPPTAIELRADAMRLRQVIANLVSNAIKYSDGGTITVRSGEGWDARLGKTAVVAVRDQGAGMTPEQQRQLFQRFTRLKTAATERASGTGLGLAISAQLVAMHGGRIDVTSEVGVGSEFTVVLPRRGVVSPGADDVSAPTSRRMQRPTVMCIDDDPDVLKALEMAFAETALEVVTARSLAEAVSALHGVRPEAICLDVHLVDGDGWSLLEALGKNDDTRAIPVVVISVEDAQAKALALGARRFIPKPFDEAALVQLVRGEVARDLRQVLVVDDSADTRGLVSAGFTDIGVTVVQAGDGQEAIERLREGLPSVIILDLLMPVMDGFAFLDQLEAEPAWQNLPVVVYSAMQLTEAQVLRVRTFGAALLRKGSAGPDETVDAALRAHFDRRGATG